MQIGGNRCAGFTLRVTPYGLCGSGGSRDAFAFVGAASAPMPCALVGAAEAAMPCALVGAAAAAILCLLSARPIPHHPTSANALIKDHIHRPDQSKPGYPSSQRTMEAVLFVGAVGAATRGRGCG
jgi:hypothetical protein